MTGLYHQLLGKQREERAAQKAKERISRLREKQGRDPIPEPEEESSGLEDLPDQIAVILAAPPITAPPAPETPKREALPPDSVENLVRRMTAIKQRIFWLRAVFATTLSQDCALESNRFLQIFQDLRSAVEGESARGIGKAGTGSRESAAEPSCPSQADYPAEASTVV